MKFIKLMRKNLRMLSVDLSWSYINNTLLKEVREETVLAHGISLPISRQTAWNWMNKCGAGRTDCKKTYYNDHHQHPVVISFRKKYISLLEKLQRRMRVWKILSEQEENIYLEKRNLSPFKCVMHIGESVMIDDLNYYIHHIDDQEGWEKNPKFHPNFTPGIKPNEEK